MRCRGVLIGTQRLCSWYPVLQGSFLPLLYGEVCSRCVDCSALMKFESVKMGVYELARPCMPLEVVGIAV